MLAVIDGALARFWGAVLRLLCGITGKSNFFFARIAIATSIALRVCAYIVPSMPTQESPDLFDGISLLFAVFCFWPWCLGVISRLEKAAESSANTSPLHPTEYWFLFVGRVIFFALGLLPPFSLYGLGGVSMAGAAYFATDFRPKRKSAIRRAAEWLKSHAPRITLPQPAPQPS